jgi:hypothetical protein
MAPAQPRRSAHGVQRILNRAIECRGHGHAPRASGNGESQRGTTYPPALSGWIGMLWDLPVPGARTLRLAAGCQRPRHDSGHHETGVPPAPFDNEVPF